MRLLRVALVGLVLGLTCVWVSAEEPGDKAGSQTEQKLVKDKIEVNYLLFLPKNYGKSDDKHPVLVFLHGAGESGKDLSKVKKNGPPKLVEKTKKDMPFIVVSPQSPGKGFAVDNMNALLDEILAKYKCDPDRVYLTGLSMGGGGTWTWATANPERFAAIVPICGAKNEPKQAAKLKNVPTWVFHGAKDPTVPLSRSEAMVNAMKEAGCDVKMTVYPNAGHDSWTEAYNNPELYTWLLSHKRAAKK